MQRVIGWDITDEVEPLLENLLDHFGSDDLTRYGQELMDDIRKALGE